MDNENDLQQSELSVKLISFAEAPASILRPLRETYWKWIALVLMNLLVMGDFISIDNPQPLQTQMQEILGIGDEEYSLLYSVWALPSIIIPFFGGYLTDKLGVRPALLIFSIALTLGQFVYAYGGYRLDFKWMLIGRAIYAIGSDPLNVAQIVITNKWFLGNEIGFAMSISTATCGIGRAINSYLVPKVFEMTNTLFGPMFFSALTCLVSMIAAILMIILDKVNDEREMELTVVDSKNALDEEKMSIKDVKYFKPITWLLILNFALTGAVFYSFNAFANDLYFQSYNFTNAEAGTIISISFIITSVSTTLFGKVVDSYGYRASLIMYNSILGIFAFAYFLAVPECDACLSSIIPQVLFGFLIGINDAATFPSLPLILEERYLGTGYGLFFVLQNVLVLAFPPIAAFIKDKTESSPGAGDGFFWMLIFFSVWMVITIGESFLLFLADKKNRRVLDKTIITDEDASSYMGSMISNAKSEAKNKYLMDQSYKNSFKEDPKISDIHG